MSGPPTVTAPPGRAPRDRGVPTSARPPAQQALPPFTPSARLRRRPAVIALGVALVALGSVTAAWLVTTLAGTTGVVVAARDVAAGQQVEAADVRIAEIGGGTGAAHVPASAIDEVVGRRATVPLLAGQVVPPQALTAARLVPGGEDEALVGLPVTAAQVPATQLQSGDRVLVVDTPAAAADPPDEVPAGLAATVVTTALDEISGVTVVTVVADTATARALAARAATGRFAVVVVGAVAPAPLDDAAPSDAVADEGP